MTVRSIAGVQRQLGWWQREDQPATAGIDRVPTQNVAKELSCRLHLFRVDEDVDAGEHAGARLLAGRVTVLGVSIDCGLLAGAAETALTGALPTNGCWDGSLVEFRASLDPGSQHAWVRHALGEPSGERG